MMKTVKVKKQMRLDDLTKYIRDNRVREKTFRTDEHGNALSNTLKVDEDGLIETYFPNMHINNSFTVEVEEGITKDTRIPKTVTLTENEDVLRSWNNSINGLKGEYPDALQIYAIIDGKLQLIWEADSDEL